MENWLRKNARPLVAAMVAPNVLIITAVAIFAYVGFAPDKRPMQIAAVALFLAGDAWLILRVLQFAKPRVGYVKGYVLFFLDAKEPYSIPIEDVEGFFLGEDEAELPMSFGREVRTTNLVVKLSRKASKWRSQSIDPLFGKWEDSYITIHGTQCEPLSRLVIERLNESLSAARQIN